MLAELEKVDAEWCLAYMAVSEDSDDDEYSRQVDGWKARVQEAQARIDRWHAIGSDEHQEMVGGSIIQQGLTSMKKMCKRQGGAMSAGSMSAGRSRLSKYT